MAAEAARVHDYHGGYFYGSAAPAVEAYPEAAPAPVEAPGVKERARERERAREKAALQTMPMVSLFAVFGAIAIATLMVFVILAQISYNEAAAETVRLNAQLTQLNEQNKALTATFESVINMKEVEQYARDVLGMSKPENYQMAVIQNTESDKAEVLAGGKTNSLQNFASFISSLLEYFKL